MLQSCATMFLPLLIFAIRGANYPVRSGSAGMLMGRVRTNYSNTQTSARTFECHSG